MWHLCYWLEAGLPCQRCVLLSKLWHTDVQYVGKYGEKLIARAAASVDEAFSGVPAFQEDRENLLEEGLDPFFNARVL